MLLISLYDNQNHKMNLKAKKESDYALVQANIEPRNNIILIFAFMRKNKCKYIS